MRTYRAVAVGLRANANLISRTLAALSVLAIGAFSQTAQAGPIGVPATAFGSAVFGGIDATGCPQPATSPVAGNCFLSYSGVSASSLLNDGDTGSSAGATANLGLGYVSASVTGAANGSPPASAYARALI